MNPKHPWAGFHKTGPSETPNLKSSKLPSTLSRQETSKQLLSILHQFSRTFGTKSQPRLQWNQLILLVARRIFIHWLMGLDHDHLLKWGDIPWLVWGSTLGFLCSNRTAKRCPKLCFWTNHTKTWACKLFAWTVSVSQESSRSPLPWHQVQVVKKSELFLNNVEHRCIPPWDFCTTFSITPA